MNSFLHKQNQASDKVMLHGGAKPILQAKLTVNTPGDVYEQEADAMADRVMRMASNETTKPVTGIIGKSLQRKCAHCEEEEKKKKPIMRKAEAGNAGMSVSSSFASSLNASKGGGAPLPPGTRSFMENAFSTDFSSVRVHADTNASEMSKGINAKAFTHGNDIYFNEGQYNPDSGEGKHLLAHELTHTVQQDEGIKNYKIQRQIFPSNYHSTEISIRWNDVFRVFNRRLVFLTSRSRNFRNVPIAALWHNFYLAVLNFHRNYHRNHASIQNGERIQLIIGASYNPDNGIRATNVNIELPVSLSAGPVEFDDIQEEITPPPAVSPSPPVVSPSPPTASSIPIKTINVDFVRLFGSTLSPATELAAANAIFSSCRINFVIGAMPPQETLATTQSWLGGDTDLNTSGYCGSASSEESNLFNQATLAHSLSSRMRVFLVNAFSSISAAGFTHAQFCADGDIFNHVILNLFGPNSSFAHAGSGYANHIVLANVATSAINPLAHEFGHNLLNSGVHSTSPNLMAPSGGIVLDATQCATCYANA